MTLPSSKKFLPPPVLIATVSFSLVSATGEERTAWHDDEPPAHVGPVTVGAALEAATFLFVTLEADVVDLVLPRRRERVAVRDREAHHSPLRLGIYFN